MNQEPHTMHAMVLKVAHAPLHEEVVAIPTAAPGHVLVKVRACAVCRTDLHIVDGELTDPKLPLIPGHEVVGRVVARASDVSGLEIGTRVGIPWLGYSCGSCRFCVNRRENLCEQARFTGYHFDGGYAQYAVADARYCFPLPDAYADAEAAPLLCAGLIGYRSLVMAGDARVLGIYGFGAAAHIVTQVAKYQGRIVYAFTRDGDHSSQVFAREVGADWAGNATSTPPRMLEAAILFAPAGSLVPLALRAVDKGGTVVCGGIHMSDIPSFPYELLWGERVVRSVANLTRRDAFEFLKLAPQVPVRTEIETFPLNQANDALRRLRVGAVKGAAVLIVD